MRSTSIRPYFRRRYLLDSAERSFFDVLRRIARDHIVLAKVRLADLIDANEQHKYRQSNFRRVCSKHVDFVICDSLLRPRVAIELDGSSHKRPDRQKRDHDVDRLFNAVSFPLLRIFVRKQYDEDLIRRLLLTKLQR